jgi:hypothetical protein
MLSTTSWSNQIFQNCKDIEGCVPISFDVGKWLFVGCIIFSFLLVCRYNICKFQGLFSCFCPSWPTKLANPRKSSRVEIFRTPSLTSWPTIIIPSVSKSWDLKRAPSYSYIQGSYDHFCFFDHISNSTKKKDDFAFFVFFTFKSTLFVLSAHLWADKFCYT